jgi:hypothetical protein
MRTSFHHQPEAQHPDLMMTIAPQPDLRAFVSSRDFSLIFSIHSGRRLAALVTRRQVLSGLKAVMLAAMRAVFGPKSFSYTSPRWLTRNVITPEFLYSAGYATNAKPPIILPRTV